jgi:RNA polymerase sigma factor for flagellar operon FliA
LIERAVAFACRRYRLTREDAEELAAIVKMKLVENDYAILRAYERRSAFATYISVVVQRMALDYRVHEWGKWRTSAEAKRLGALATDLEKLLHRDARTIDEAAVFLARKHEGVTRASLETLAARLPEREPKRRDVDLEQAASVALTGAHTVEERVLARDRAATSEQLSSVMTTVMQDLDEDDRLVIQLRFEGGMTVAQIARALGIDQKLLYRRIERCMRDIKANLLQSGISPRDVLDLIGRDDAPLRFGLGKPISRPSIASDERATAHTTEGSP